jgi:hypothetical protein
MLFLDNDGITIHFSRPYRQWSLMDLHIAHWSSPSSQELVVDSKASRHITKHQHVLSNYQQTYNGEVVIIGDGSPLSVSRCGDVIMGNKFGVALHVPGIGPNLLSTSPTLTKR